MLVYKVFEFLLSFIENFEKVKRHPTFDMATILVVTSTAKRKGLKLLSVAAKWVRDQGDKISEVTIGQKGNGRHPLKDKGKKK